MKTNELMIGDWVSAGYNSKVTGIDLNTDAIRIAGNIGWFKTNEHEPIPITPEILEANGFVPVEIRGGTEYSNPSAGVGLIKVDSYDYWIENIEVGCMSLHGSLKYVHEFQHALRLSGIVELADNFVIKKGGQQ